MFTEEKWSTSLPLSDTETETFLYSYAGAVVGIEQQFSIEMITEQSYHIICLFYNEKSRV